MEADIGVGFAGFKLNTVQASLVPTEVPESASIGIFVGGAAGYDGIASQVVVSIVKD